MTTVGVVGLGRMGSRVARRLLGAGHDVVVWNRSPERMAPLVEHGAQPAATPADAAARAAVLITFLSDSAALRSVTEGRGGIAAGTDASSTVIEMSTVGPAGIDFLASTLPADVGLLDAPVLGSIGEAESGSLTILVGGPAALLERVRPVLSTLGTALHVGPLGAGAAAKLVANATLFGTLAMLGEAVALARSLGLSDAAMHQVLAATPIAAQARRRRPTMESGEYPPRFALSLARKDADLIACAAAAGGVDVRVADATRAWLADAESTGLGDRDYTAVLEAILWSGGDGNRRRATARETPLRRFDYDGLIVDLDGVVWLGGEPIKGAARAITTLRARGMRVLFVTNDPQSSRDEHAGQLVALGIPATAADVITAAAATARHLRAQRHLAGCGVLVVGSRALRDEIAQAGFRLVPAAEACRAEVVVVGGHDGFDFEELRAATTALHNGAALYATGRDAVYPTRDGPRPATGAILAAVEVAAGVTATVIGKPEPFMFEVARGALTGCRHVAVIGDHLISDVVGAKRAGLDAILVLTGTATRDDLEQAAIQPDLVLPSLAALPGAVPEPGDP